MSVVTRQPHLVVTTPYHGAPKVVCFKDTWTGHLAGRVVSGSEALVMATLQAPTAVVTGTTNPNYVAFVNHAAPSAGQGSPFVVFVDPQSSPLPAVSSVGHRRDFRDLQKHTILWTPDSQTPGAKK